MKTIKILFFLLFISHLGLANVITVTTHLDENSDNGMMSLREAVDLANATPGKDTIVFAVETNGNTFFLNIGSTDEDNNADGDLDFLDADGICLLGNGVENTIIDGNETERIFHNIGGDVAIVGIAAQNGNAQDGIGHGGVLYVNKSDLQFSFTNMVFTSNEATRSGGALYLSGSNHKIDILDASFNQNDAGTSGGAIHFSGANAMTDIDDCNFSGNTSGSDGGAAIKLNSSGGPTNIRNTLFSGNATEENGGAIDMNGSSGIYFLEGVTMENNTAEGDGGAIEFNSSTGEATIVNTTLSNNRANENGGAISLSISNSILSLNFVTIFNNTADADNMNGGTGGGLWSRGTTTVQNSIIQDNTGENADCDNNSGSGTITSLGGNVVGATCPTTGEDTNDPANLGPLQDNGGGALTHALLAGSAALNFGNCGEVQVDQRSLFRNDGQCDAGAFEEGAEVNPTPLPTMGQWSLILFGCLLLLVGVGQIRGKGILNS